MKHPLTTTVLLIILFIVTQIVGLALLSTDIKDITKNDSGAIVVQHNPTIIGDRPQTTGAGSFLYIAIGVAIGTALMLLIIRFKLFTFWKGWFFLAVWLATSVAFGVFLPSVVAFVLCFVLAAWKVFYPNPYVHNLVEIFMYAGIALIIVPIFTLFWAFMLLILISIYDMIAVWHSKHMVTMAEAQKEQKMFAGLFIPKPTIKQPTVPHTSASRVAQRVIPPRDVPSPSKAITKENEKKNVDTGGGAILGGGDLAFPLIFSGVAMEWLIGLGVPRVTALYETLIISLGATVAISALFVFAKRDRYYPAMPFVSAGCVLGFLIVWMIQML